MKNRCLALLRDHGHYHVQGEHDSDHDVNKYQVLTFLRLFQIIYLTEPNTPLNDVDHVGSFCLRRNELNKPGSRM